MLRGDANVLIDFLSEMRGQERANGSDEAASKINALITNIILNDSDLTVGEVASQMYDIYEEEIYKNRRID